MTTKRFFLALIAFTLLLPLSGCGCRRNACSDRSSPPPQPCCNSGRRRASCPRPVRELMC